VVQRPSREKRLKYFVRFVRLSFAVLVGCAITLYVAFFAVLFRLFGQTHRANRMAHVWARAGRWSVYWVLGIEVKVNLVGDCCIDKNRPTFVYGNHGHTFELFAKGFAVSHFCPEHFLIPSIKSEHWYNPFGWASAAVGAPLINRSKGDSAVALIQRFVKRSVERRLAFVIFPDGTRSVPKHLKESREHFGNGEDLVRLEMAQVQVPPRKKGAWAAHKSMPVNTQYIRIFTGSNTRASRLFDLIFDPPTELVFRVEVVDRLPDDKSAFQQRLIVDFLEVVKFKRSLWASRECSR
jgi:1-acyl-sn-glycerol-3-phosphate acyltransferase